MCVPPRVQRAPLATRCSSLRDIFPSKQVLAFLSAMPSTLPDPPILSRCGMVTTAPPTFHRPMQTGDSLRMGAGGAFQSFQWATPRHTTMCVGEEMTPSHLKGPLAVQTSPASLLTLFTRPERARWKLRLVFKSPIPARARAELIAIAPPTFQMKGARETYRPPLFSYFFLSFHPFPGFPFSLRVLLKGGESASGALCAVLCVFARFACLQAGSDCPARAVNEDKRTGLRNYVTDRDSRQRHSSV
ncbi:hypothetical protein B0J11DRAFT_302833 [Dendryphion nanum]|uniref:Uncharacterized protein n=1 Tax=Dendryphion nanum TaxID=256645 RepID=A0A9P9IN85_9PLEO|nr:hypothetical protein B0J11DRAFT_302833 [Dendryphion nanum]